MQQIQLRWDMPPARPLGSPAEAKSKLDDINEKLRSVAYELRQHGRRKRAKLFLPKQVKLAGKICLCQTKDDALLAAFLKFKTGADIEDIGRWTDELRSWFNLASAGDRKIMVAGGGDLQVVRASKIFTKFLSEKNLHDWVGLQNTTKGISPATGLVLDSLPGHGLQGRSANDSSAPRKYKSNLKFCQRWRRRWNVSHGKITTLDEVEPIDLHRKVRIT